MKSAGRLIKSVLKLLGTILWVGWFQRLKEATRTLPDRGSVSDDPKRPGDPEENRTPDVPEIWESRDPVRGGDIASLPTGVIPGELELVLLRVRLRCHRRAAWLRMLWSEEGLPRGRSGVTNPEMDTHLADRDAPAAEAAWLESEPSIRPIDSKLLNVEQQLAADADTRLNRLQMIFGLSHPEVDLLHTCLAHVLDPSIGRIYAYLQDHTGRSYATEELAARVFGHGRQSLWGPDSPLRTWDLITPRDAGPGESPTLSIDPFVRDWLEGRDHLDTPLVGNAKYQPEYPPLDGWPTSDAVETFRKSLTRAEPHPVRLTVAGIPGSGRKAFAAGVAAELGRPLLSVDTDRIKEPDWPQVFMRVNRQAHLDDGAIAWHGEQLFRLPWPEIPVTRAIQFVISEAGRVAPPGENITESSVELPIASVAERRELWRQFVPTSVGWPEKQFEALVRRHRVVIRDIVAVGRHDPETPAAAAELVKGMSRGRLGDLAQLLETPFERNDLILNETLLGVLDDLIFEARERVDFWEQPEASRLFPQGRGLLALLSGPPGTGKTMAAQVVAAELNLDLLRIDLSSVVSKYVGETSQNLERILSRAAHMDVVLLFDEADALFGRRTEISDAHDRFANTDTGYLLQAIESYQGLAFLATNKKGNIDPAFIRRLRYLLDFQRPDEHQRRAIWDRVVSELAGEDRAAALAMGLNELSQGLDSSGSQIKFAVLTGLFAARRVDEPLSITHLLLGMDRELQKEGRAISRRERERIIVNAR